MRAPLAFQSYTHRYKRLSAQRVVNLMVERQPSEARAQTPLLPTPGLVPHVTLAGGPVRGMHIIASSAYVVAGSKLYRVGVDGEVFEFTGAVGGTAPVFMDSDGLTCIIVDTEIGTAGLFSAGGSALVGISDPGFPGATSATWIANRFVVTVPDSRRIAWSETDVPTSWPALNYASAEAHPDYVRVVKRIGQHLWIFGDISIEIWAVSSDPNAPFQPITGGYIERGCQAPFSIARVLSTVFWLGDDRVVYRAEGWQPVRISTHAIEEAIKGYAETTDARGWCYEQEGHSFYVLTFPTAGRTWVYDMTTQFWHERVSPGGTVWRAVVGERFQGEDMVLAGDIGSGAMMFVDAAAATEFGTTVDRYAVGIPINAEGKRVFMRRVEVDLEPGVGTPSGAGSDPTIWLRISRDGGQTYENSRVTRIGAAGEYAARAVWERCGMARNPVLQVGYTQPIRTPLIAANLEIEAGGS